MVACLFLVQVKHPLREPRVELLGLPIGDYVVRVRCRSHNYGLWSQWSSTLLMSIPSRPPAGTLGAETWSHTSRV